MAQNSHAGHGEARPRDLVCRNDDHEGLGIDIMNDELDLRDLRERHDGQQHIALLPRERGPARAGR